MPMIMLFAVVAINYYGHYENTIGIITSEYEAKIDLIERSLYNETKYTEVISKMVEKNINDNMEKNSKVMVSKYNSDPDVLNWNLEEMKEQFDGMDIYIIDKNFNVIDSTIKEEIGLDLKLYSNLAKLLKERLEGDKFESDSINFSSLEGELKKYSYIPTPDNKYLIELSVNIKEGYPELEDLNIKNLSKNLKDDYDFIEEIRVYSYDKDKGYSRGLDSSENIIKEYPKWTKDRDLYMKKALETDEVQEKVIRDENYGSYTLRYVPYKAYYEEDRLAWLKSYAVEILYNDQILIDDISDQKKSFKRSMLTIGALYFGFSYIILYLLAKNQKAAYTDYLTKLPNRKKFEEMTEYKMTQSNRKDTRFAIMFFDLDKFKKINDSFGHNVGDKVLQGVAERIKNNIREEDLVSRLGGDEFTVLISNVESYEEIVEISERMSEIFETPIIIDGNEIEIRPSIGISIYPDHGWTVETLLLKADNSMYEAKSMGSSYKIYEENKI